MATKDEYYMRIIASLQSEIASLKTGQSEAMKEIKALKSTVASQQKEIEAQKASQGALQKSSEPQQKWIATENLLLVVKRVCDDVIRTKNEQLPTMFANRHEFDNFRKLVEQKFLSADTFTDYKKSLDVRLKTIEEKQKRHFSLLTFKRNIQTILYSAKSSFNPNIIRFTKQLNLKWLIQILIFLSICLIAAYIYSSIKD